MLVYVVALHAGRRYSIRADGVNLTQNGCLELHADTPAGRQVVALFDRSDVVSVVAKEFLVSEEQGESSPHLVGSSAIPF